MFGQKAWRRRWRWESVNVATVWDGEIAGMAEGLSRTKTMQEKKVLILADSKAAIAAVKKAGKNRKGEIQAPATDC